MLHQLNSGPIYANPVIGYLVTWDKVLKVQDRSLIAKELKQ